MKLKSSRPFSELSEILYNPSAKDGPEIAYWVFSEISKGKWENMTVTSAGFYGDEFTKTYGHYHGTNVVENYLLVSGKGVLQLQKKIVENETVVENRVESVYMVQFEKPGEKISIPYEFGHSFSNVGNEPLVTFDDWRSGHTDHDYEIIQKQKGLCYYLLRDEHAGIKLVPNPNYTQHPKPIWITPNEFNELF
ncbi:hypothetical protein A2619_02140 [candidate division WWE3 bacterium RIFOXYD1_FULL_39_9]|uniref:glucose-6-phosphate isomerase n=1 Tax=candidate division WWE3 bacterium RIFOXYD1_FULL_39_9 TaxID=1802649 RepID=A0A1F4X3F1_UNCKA|nr:MAG: hypothetical protein A2619_02140 [candidate division WWE3 bacterium RIFOXYD1_FULL_39_9]